MVRIVWWGLSWDGFVSVMGVMIEWDVERCVEGDGKNEGDLEKGTMTWWERWACSYQDEGGNG